MPSDAIPANLIPANLIPAGLIIVVARASDGTFGHEGAMPWHLPADSRRFKALTMGRAMIMGRKTFESLPGLLPGRRHIVLTRDSRWQAAGAEPVATVEQALSLAGPGAAVIGGPDVVALFDPFAVRLELTEVHADYAGDTVLPAPGAHWREVARDRHGAVDGRPAFDFVSYERVAD